MDPLACYTTLCDAIEHDDRDCAIEHADALVNWLRRGGFLPQGVSLAECKQAVAKAYEMPRPYDVWSTLNGRNRTCLGQVIATSESNACDVAEIMFADRVQAGCNLGLVRLSAYPVS